MSNTRPLLAEIEAFLRKSGMNPSTFGHKAVNDGKLVGRLRKGKTVTLETASVITTFIADQVAEMDRANRARPQRARAAAA